MILKALYSKKQNIWPSGSIINPINSNGACKFMPAENLTPALVKELDFFPLIFMIIFMSVF